MTGRASVLVVDDEPANRKLLGDLVRLEGYDPLFAVSGAEALDIIGRGAVDLVLLDVMMPRMSGLEVLEHLAARGVIPGLPVVVVSALSDRQTRISALERGAVDFLNKPIDRHEMAARLRNLVRMKQLQDELALREEKLRVTLHSIGDAVVATDGEGRVTRLNSVAEALTGWSAAEAVGRPLVEIFDIINQRTRLPAPIPVMATLAHGTVHDLANDTVLIARDGTERPIADSCAPIRTADGRVIGAVLVFRDVTREHEAKEAERALTERLRAANESLERLVLERTSELRASEARLLRAQAVARVGSVHVDLATGRRDWSAEAYRIYGIPEGTPFSFELVLARVHPEDRQVVAELQARAGRGESMTAEWRIVVNGNVRWLRGTTEIDVNADGKPVRTVAVFEDVTERKAADAQIEAAARSLEAAAQRLELATQSAQIGVFDFDVAENELKWDEQTGRIFGTPAETFLGTVQAWEQRVHPDDLARAKRELMDALAGTRDFHTEFRVVWPDGQIRYVSGDAMVLRDAAGTPTRMIGVSRDVTERKLAELALEESYRFSQASLDALGANIAVLDGDGRIVATNRAWREFAEENGERAGRVGVGVSYLAACDAAIAEGDAMAADAAALIREVIGGRVEGSFTYPCHAPHEQRWFLCRVTRFAGDGPVRVVLAHENLTALVESQLHAEKSAQRLDLLAENLPLVLWEGEERGPGPISTRWASDNFERILGVRSAELAGTQAWVQHIHPDNLPNLRRATAPGVWIEQYRWSKPDGTVVHLLSGRTATAGADGSLSTLGFALDISEQKRLEEAVLASLREKELLLKEIHHRVKNNLQIISSLLAMQSDATPDPGTKDALQEGVHRVRSMALIHERLYQSSTLARIDFGEYAQALSAFLFRSYKAAGPVKLVVDVEPTDLNIETAVPCGLILNELVANALKHAFKDGRGGELRVTVKPDAEGGVRLTVQDTGPGLPPGFRIDQAKSLGLQLVTSLTKQIKGTLTVSNEGGASFSIAFKELAYAAR